MKISAKKFIFFTIFNILVTISLIVINNHYLRQDNQTVAYVDLESIYNDFITKTAKITAKKSQKETQEAIEQESLIFNQAINILKSNLTEIAQQEDLIIINNSNKYILAGGEDHTQKIKLSLEHIIGHLKKKNHYER